MRNSASRKLWPVMTFFLGASVCVAGWAAFELGFLDGHSVMAAEKGDLAGIETLQRNLNDRLITLDEKEKSIAAKEKDLADKERLMKEHLAGVEKTLEKTRQELQEAREAKSKLEASLKVASEAPVDTSVEFKKVYERMEAKQASGILDGLETPLAARILTSMNQARAAEVLGKMNVDRARKITQFLAEQPVKAERR